MAIPDNSQNYADVAQGVDRITEILKQQAAPKEYSPYQPQAVNLPANIMNMLAYSSYDPGNGNGGDFAKNVQSYAHTQQADQLEQQKSILGAYEAKLKLGDAQTKALDDKIKLFVGDDPAARNVILQNLHDDPESIDPNNAFQVSTKIAGIVKRNGLQNTERNLDLAGKRADIAFKMAEANKMSNTNKFTLEGAPTPQPTVTTPSLTGSTPPPIPATSPTANLNQSVAPQPSNTPPGVRLILEGGLPYTKGLKEGMRWGATADGRLVPVEMSVYNQDGVQKTTPASQMSTSLNKMKGAYDELHALGADVSTENKFVNNKVNQALLSEGPSILGVQLPGGQTLMKGTKQQAIVDKIGAGISGTLLDIKSASGAGAKQFDSDRDVLFMKQQASSPTNDYGANLEILNNLSLKYTGKPLEGYNPQKPSGTAATGVWSVTRVK